MLNKIHTVCDVAFRVNETPPIENEEEEEGPQQPYEKPSKNGKNLLQLNDCLYEILKQLSIFDLLSVANTCHTLRNNVTDLFSTRAKTLYLGTHSNSIAFAPDQITSTVRVFGPNVNELIISMENIKEFYHNEIIAVLSEYCTNLASLELICVTINRSMLPNLHTLFNNLKTLRLDRCKIYRYCDDKFMDLFINCDSLTKLKIDKLDGIDSINSIQVFPNLEAFTYCHRSYSVFIDNLIQQHRKLKKLNIDTRIDVPTSIISIIGTNCPILEKLYVSNLPPKVRKPWRGFEKLKKIKFSSQYHSVGVLFENLRATDSLEHLELKTIRIDGMLFEHLKRFENLKVLALIRVFGTLANSKYLFQLTNINELIIISSALIVDAYMLQIVTALPNLHTFSCFGDDLVLNLNTAQMISTICNQRNLDKKFTINVYRSPSKALQNDPQYSEFINLNKQDKCN